ncbi:hypothetical protein TNCV_3769191 [Trichonephila clavipes]|nr:hypothetical protein TNCV_3769191 [Trichonephila clavipes]
MIVLSVLSNCPAVYKYGCAAQVVLIDALFSCTRAFGDVILNRGQVTWTTPELAHRTNGRTFQLSTDLTCIAALHGGLLVVLGSNWGQGKPQSDTYTTRLLRPTQVL